MLSPSSLFFGTPDPEPPLDMQSIWAGGKGMDMWQDGRDADKRTNVPGDAQQQREMPSGLPPGLSLKVGGGSDAMRTPTMMKPVFEGTTADNSDDEEEPDDEADNSDDALQEGLVNASGALQQSELPSIGSASHFSGICDRCCFHPKGRCLNGFNCQHCHFDHDKRKRKNKKKSKSKHLQSLDDDDSIDMMSTSAGGSSLPMSPEAYFGSSMLPQTDFPVCASTVPQHGDASFLSQLTLWPGSDAAARPPSATIGGAFGEPNWFQAATSMPPQSYPPGGSPALLGPSADNGYPSRIEMESQLGGDRKDSREEYISLLEAENRYLRTSLIGYLGPNAAALSLLPPLPGGPPQQSAFFPSDPTGGPSPPGGPTTMSAGPLLVPESLSLPAMTSASQGLSSNALPFWPGVDASGRFNPPGLHQSCNEQVSVGA